MEGCAISTYLKLVRKLQLRSIRTEQELDAAQAVLDELLRQQLEGCGEEYLAALTDLIELYGDKAHPILSGADVLRMLMESNGLSQAALARKVGIA